MEPERNIEKLLKAYAKKRKGDVGGPFKLDNVARRRLQGEAARVAAEGEPDDSEASMSMWQLFRWQWAFLVTFFLLIFFAAAIFFPAISNVKSRGQQYAEVSKLKEIGSAAQMAAGENNGRLPATLDSLTNRLGSATVLREAVSGKKFVYVAANKDLESLPSNAVIAFSPTAKPNRAVLFADGRVEMLDSNEFDRVTNAVTATFALNAASAPPPPSSIPAPTSAIVAPAEKGLDAPGTVLQTAAASTPNESGAALGKATAQNLALNQQSQFKNLAAKKSANVLRSFQVQQNGNALKVVDADGSVYDGTLIAQTDKVAAKEKFGVDEDAATRKLSDQVQAVTRQKVELKPQKIPETDFRVAGYNRTLKQNVVFTGNFVTLSNNDTNLLQSQMITATNFIGLNGATQSGAAQSQNNRAYQNAVQQYINAGIYGNAVINNSSNIEINAVPTP